MNRKIVDVFNYTTPISFDQINQRSFVDRLGYREKIFGELFQDGVLIISGYSSIGKTTLTNLATTKKVLRTTNAPFTSVISVRADNWNDGEILNGIYGTIFEYISGKKREVHTPETVAEAIFANRLLLIIDGVNSLYNHPLSSRELFNLCKVWTDIPRGMAVQSKIVLIFSGLPLLVNRWLNHVSSGNKIRLPHMHISLPPWQTDDLLEIINIGSQNLAISFDNDLKTWMVKIACGLPATLTLLAALSSRRANNEQDTIPHETTFAVELSDLHGVFGESQKFREILYRDDRIDALNSSALFALYFLGSNNGKMSEREIYELLDTYGFVSDQNFEELQDLISITTEEEVVYWNINELSYGTFAFLRLYHRSKLNVPDAQQINQALNSNQNENPVITSFHEIPKITTRKSGMIPILFLAADPTNASRLRLGEEFREIQEKLKLAKLRDNFKLELPQLSIRPPDIAQALLDTQPQIVHFSGHGASTGALCFENQTGQVQLVQPDALAALFEQFSSQINCVLLNACYSETQAKAIAEHIEYVIGMNQAIGDKAAIAFAIGFYQALGAGRPIEDAYKLGCVQIRLQSIPEHLTPVLIQKEQVQP